jgi:hypothetical protein
MREDLVRHCLNLVRIRDIDLMVRRLRSLFGDETSHVLRGARVSPINQRDARTLSCKGDGNARANAGRCARNDGDTSF